MNDIKLEMVGMLSGKKWETMHDVSRRVYDEKGLCPTIHTGGGYRLGHENIIRAAIIQNSEADSQRVLAADGILG